jgi:hypothetical protein
LYRAGLAGLCRDREQTGILGENLRLELAQPRPRIHAQPVAQLSSGPPVRLQRVALPPLPVQGEHQQLPQPFPVRVVAQPRFRLGCRRRRIVPVKASRHQGLARRAAQLDETRRLGCRVRRVLQIGEGGRRAPGSQSHAQRPRCLDRSQVLDINEGLLEPVRVNGLGRDDQPVAAAPMLQLGRCRSIEAGESLPQAGDVADECPLGTRRSVVTPGGIDQAVDWDHSTGPDQKRAENPARNRSTYRHRTVRTLDLQRTQNPQHHALNCMGSEPRARELPCAVTTRFTRRSARQLAQ